MLFVTTITYTTTFDPAESEANWHKHGVSLRLARAIDWSEVWCAPDDRRDYGELREIGYAQVDGYLYCVVSPSAATFFESSACAKRILGRSNDMSSKPKLYVPTPEEDAAIARGIEADPDTFVPSDAQFAQMKRRGGRPKLEHPKVALTVRYDADIIERFKTTGEGWQTRMNNALREWLDTHRLA